MGDVFDLIYNMVKVFFGYVGILFDAFDMESFIIGILFVLLAGRLLLLPIFSGKLGGGNKK